MTSEIHPTQKRIEEAIDRIARTADGVDLYVFLQRRIMAVKVLADSGALQLDNGERMFASTLIGLMAKGMHESGGRTSSTGGSEQPIVVPRPEPVRVSGTGGTRRRVGPDTIVPGWNNDPA